MFNRRTLSVIKRELRSHLMSRSFIIMTLLVPVFLFGIIGIQSFIRGFDGDENTNIIIAAESGSLAAQIKNELDKQEFIKNGFYKVSYETIDSNQIQSFINTHKEELMDEKLSGIVYISSSAEKSKEIAFYSKNPKNRSLFDKIDDHINNVLLSKYFKEKELTESDISFATERLNFKEFKVSEDKEIKEEGYGNLIISFLFTFLLYFSLLMFGSAMLTSVIEEKNNRIIEVLLSSLDSTELLTGKILGSSITGVLQMAIWLLPVFVIISSTIFILPAEFTLSLNTWQLLYFLLNYFIALITFIGLYAAVGSIFTNSQDAQSGMWPIMLLIMIPFFIAISMQSNPNNELAKITSMVPFTSLIVMPARITIMEVPGWQFILAIIVNIATMLIIFPVAGKIYRVGILSTGKKPKWSEVIKWVRYKY
ncbi:MAG: ABC transporter permease [Ignavibacteriaceae bacterium]